MEFTTLFQASTWILPVILAITLHEAGHGFVAERFGDDTAKRMGRVTFNPLKHIDPIGTLLLPGMLLIMQAPILFGYAKPVPVDFGRLRPLRLGMVLVAIAGPGINILLAILSALLLHESHPEPGTLSWLNTSLSNAVSLNCALAIFNMLPLLPLDGGRVVRAVLPGVIGERYAKTEPYGMAIMMLLLLLPPLVGITFIMEKLLMLNSLLLSTVLFLTSHN